MLSSKKTWFAAGGCAAAICLYSSLIGFGSDERQPLESALAHKGQPSQAGVFVPSVPPAPQVPSVPVAPLTSATVERADEVAPLTTTDADSPKCKTDTAEAATLPPAYYLKDDVQFFPESSAAPPALAPAAHCNTHVSEAVPGPITVSSGVYGAPVCENGLCPSAGSEASAHSTPLYLEQNPQPQMPMVPPSATPTYGASNAYEDPRPSQPEVDPSQMSKEQLIVALMQARERAAVMEVRLKMTEEMVELIAEHAVLKTQVEAIKGGGEMVSAESVGELLEMQSQVFEAKMEMMQELVKLNEELATKRLEAMQEMMRLEVTAELLQAKYGEQAPASMAAKRVYEEEAPAEPTRPAALDASLDASDFDLDLVPTEPARGTTDALPPVPSAPVPPPAAEPIQQPTVE